MRTAPSQTALFDCAGPPNNTTRGGGARRRRFADGWPDGRRSGEKRASARVVARIRVLELRSKLRRGADRWLTGGADTSEVKTIVSGRYDVKRTMLTAPLYECPRRVEPKMGGE